jgi:chromate transporter
VAFVAPSFLMVLALSAVYVRYRGLPWMQGVFYGVAPAVVAIVARSAVRLARSTLGRDRLLWAVFAANAAVVAWTAAEPLSLLVAGGAAVLLARRRARPAAALGAAVMGPPWPAAALAAPAVPADPGALAQLFLFFAKAGAAVFGSGLAIVPFLYGGAVQQYGWLTERQFLDAVAVSMITPGPVVITVAFVGYLVAGPAGAVASAVGVFLPVFLAVVLAAPAFRRLVARPGVHAFVEGVTAGATGAIAGAAVVIAVRAVVDLPTAGIALASLGALAAARRMPEPLLVALAAVAGLALGGRPAA